MKFANWMLLLPDGSETGPHGVTEIRTLLPADETLLARTRIRSMREESWVLLGRHSHCHLFLSKEQRAALLKSATPLPPLPFPRIKAPQKHAAAKTVEVPDRQEPVRRSRLQFNSVQEMLDFNAVCAGQDLVRDRIRNRPARYRTGSRFINFVWGILFYNTLFFVISYAITLFIVRIGFLKTDGSIFILALQMLLLNPISLASLIAGVTLTTTAVFWFVFVIQVR